MSHVIIGGGISGLSAAYYLSKTLNGIKLYESTNRVGGWINSFKTNKGTLFELGPRTLRFDPERAPNTIKLCDELGISSLITPVKATNKAVKKKFIYCQNQLVTFPDSFISLFRIKPPYIKPVLKAVWLDFMTPKKVVEDESVYDFVTRRFGEDYAAIPCSALVCGIFAGDSKEISVKAVLHDAFEKEQEYGSVVKGSIKGIKKMRRQVSSLNKEMRHWVAWSFQDGLETLPIHLKKNLEEKKVDIGLEKRCSKIAFKNGKAILTVDGNEETVDYVYSALPSRELARILEGKETFLKNELSSIPFVSICVVNLEYAGDLIKNKGFGFLVPPNQNLPVLGISYDSCIFPQEGKTVLTVLMGGRWFEQYFGSNPDEGSLLQTAQDHITSILDIKAAPVCSKVTVLRNCIPQYIVGHEKRVQKIREYIASKKLPLALIGNSFDGVGVNDAILSAKRNVNQTLSQLNLLKQNKTVGTNL